MTIRQLSLTSRIPYMTLNRTVKRLVTQGLLASKKVGRSLLCHIIDCEKTQSMKDLSKKDSLIIDAPALKTIKKLSKKSDTIRQISIAIKVPYMTTNRTIKELVSLGILTMQKVGKSNLCRLNKKSELLEGYMKII